jgi:integrase
MTLAVKKNQLRSRPHFPHVGVRNARTGWRQGELLNLKSADVDWGAGVLRLRPTSTVAGTTTKNDQGRVFPFRPLRPLEEALRSQRTYTDEVARRTGTIPRYVFHREGEQIREFRAAWTSACERAGVKLSRDRVFHSLRASTTEGDLHEAVGRLDGAGPEQKVTPLKAEA